jgi:hypothetical protein
LGYHNFSFETFGLSSTKKPNREILTEILFPFGPPRKMWEHIGNLGNMLKKSWGEEDGRNTKIENKGTPHHLPPPTPMVPSWVHVE